MAITAMICMHDSVDANRKQRIRSLDAVSHRCYLNASSITYSSQFTLQIALFLTTWHTLISLDAKRNTVSLAWWMQERSVKICFFKWSDSSTFVSHIPKFLPASFALHNASSCNQPSAIQIPHTVWVPLWVIVIVLGCKYIYIIFACNHIVTSLK